MAGNLVVDDEYVRQSASDIKAALVKLDRVAEKYLEILKAMREEAIQDGAVALALEAYNDYAFQIKDALEQIGDDTRSLLENYQIAIDDADQFLF